MKLDVQNILVLLFTGINCIIVMPQIGKILDKINGNEKEKRNEKISNINNYIYYLFNYRERIYEKHTRRDFKCI